MIIRSIDAIIRMLDADYIENADIEEKINADKLLKWCFLYTLENFLNANKKGDDNINDTIET